MSPTDSRNCRAKVPLAAVTDSRQTRQSAVAERGERGQDEDQEAGEDGEDQHDPHRAEDRLGRATGRQLTEEPAENPANRQAGAIEHERRYEHYEPRGERERRLHKG
jgi:hypothetical protein